MPVPAVWQQTLKTAISCTGKGLHSGVPVHMILRPAPAGHGIVFRRSDLFGRTGDAALADVRARWDLVADTRLCTALANAAGTRVATVEHLMAAFAGSGIDNALVEVSGAELPVMDGSASPFVFLIECAGIAEQAVPRRALRVLRRVAVEDGSKHIALTPAAETQVTCEIEYESRVVARQRLTASVDPDSFKREIARARTYGFRKDIEWMHRAGLARGGSLENAVVIDGDGVVNPDGLRFRDEFVRHKVLDCIGDLYLAGGPILGHARSVRAGHALNNRLLRTLFETRDAWEWVELSGYDAMPQQRRAALRVAAGD